MISSLKKKLIIVEGHYNSLSLAIFDKTKFLKVKNYNLSNIDDNKDLFFESIKDFMKNKEYFETIYYGMGPGSFTNIRRILSFVKALSLTECSGSKMPIKTIGVNNLTILGFHFLKNYLLNNKQYILPVIENAKNIFTQIYKINQKKNFPLEKKSEVEIISKEDIPAFLTKKQLNINEVNIIYLSNNNKLLNESENIKFVSKLYLVDTFHEIINIIDNKNFVFKNYQDIFEKNLRPLYAKEPNTN